MSIRRPAVATAAAATAILWLASPAAGRQWHPALTISPAGTFPSSPAAALGAPGQALAAWSARLRGPRFRVEVRTRGGYRGRWVREFASGTLPAAPSRIAASMAPDGAAVVAWRAPGGGVRAAVRDGRRAPWRVQAVPSGPAPSGVDDFAAARLSVAPGGAATLTWAAREDAGWVVRAARRARAGAPWTAVAPLAADGAPALGLGRDGGAVAAWSAPAVPGSGAPPGPVRAALLAAGASWGLPVTLAAAGGAPSAAIEGGRAVVAWEELPGGSVAGARVLIGSADAAGAWSAALPVSAGRAPTVAADAAGDAVLAWAGPAEPGRAAPLLAAQRPAGGTFGAPAGLLASESVTAIEIGQAQAAMSARGRAFVAAVDPQGPGTGGALLATAPGWGGPWDAVRVPTGSDDPRVSLAASPAGDALALVPASPAVSSGGTVLAVAFDGAARPVVRARVTGRPLSGGAVAWTVTIRNAGRVRATGVRLRLSVCCGARLLASQPAGTPGTRPWVGWSLGALAPGRARTVRLRVRPRASTVTRARLSGEAWAVAAPRIPVAGTAIDAARLPVLG